MCLPYASCVSCRGDWRSAEWRLLCPRPRGRGLAGGYAPAQRPRHEGALAHAWNHISGASARFGCGRPPLSFTTRRRKTTCKPVLKRAGEGPKVSLAAQHRRHSFGSFPAARRRRASSFRLAPPKQPKSEGATRPRLPKAVDRTARSLRTPQHAVADTRTRSKERHIARPRRRQS